MEESVVGGHKNNWLESINKEYNSDSRKYQTTARFSKDVFKELQRLAEENDNSLAEEIRKATRKGLQVEKE